jgi:hypothetical protein
MKLSGRKLFLGVKVDAAMKRQLDDGKAPGRPIFKAGDPAHLELLEHDGEFYLGRVLEAGFAIDQLEDLKRNIRSIVTLTFPDHKLSGSLRLFAVDEDQAAASLAAAS